MFLRDLCPYLKKDFEAKRDAQLNGRKWTLPYLLQLLLQMHFSETASNIL